MTHEYAIPTVRIRAPRAAWWTTLVVGVLAVFISRHFWLLVTWHRFRDLAVLWAIYFVLASVQWVASWLERPRHVTEGEAAALRRLRVAICIPVFNEDPEVLDRVLFSVFRQSRLPDLVEVVDDGSHVDYAEVCTWWWEHHPPEVEFSWIRQENQGKKYAHALTFRRDPAEIFVTLDSDTVLEEAALEEGLKPFCDPEVQSVAGLELAWNHDQNVMTRLNSTRQMVWQLVTCSAQNVARGNVLINRGTYALYRGELVRDVLDAYVGEVFGRHPIRLGDDTFLTTMALMRGRAVQQPSAVCLTMYPENLSHHLRQWTRWMRGTTLRTFWRLRYLQPSCWGFLYTVLTLWWYLASLAMTVALAVTWPRSGNYIRAMVVIGALWALLMATRLWVVQRSDQSLLGRIGAIAIAPLSSLWVMLVLRIVRIYGTFTFLNQGWTTRSDVEVRATAREVPRRIDPALRPAMQSRSLFSAQRLRPNPLRADRTTLP